MSNLPKIKHPLYTMTMPSTGKEVKYRSFTGAEEKILLTAKESDELQDIFDGVKQILTNCVQYDVNKMSLFDIEYALIKIRSNSVNNVIEFTIQDDETEENIDLTLDLANVKVVYDENHKKNIQADDETILVMRYPTLDEFQTLLNDQEDKKAAFDVMVSCIESVIHGDAIINMDDVSRDEIDIFVDDLNDKTLREINNFFETMPVVRHEIPYTRKDGVEKTFVIQGMQTFFI